LLTSTKTFAQIASGFHSPSSFGAKALAQGNAFSARADDATAIVFNPAGLSQLKKPQLSLGSSFVLPTVEYEGENITDHMDTTVNMIPNLFFASPLLKNKLYAGIGITAPYGLSGEWEEDGFSRFVVTDFFMSIINVNPTITYKPFPFISIGAGLDYYYGESDLEKRLNIGIMNSSLTGAPIDESTPEGFQDLDDIHGDGVGYNIGLLYHPAARHSFGISFRSKANIDFKGSLKLSGLSGATKTFFGTDNFSTTAETKISLPEMLTFGYAYKHDNRWSIEANLQWTNWSRFDVLRLDFDTTNALLEANNEEERNWDDTLGVAIGGEYSLNKALKIRGGYAFHETPVPSETFEPSIPQGSRHAVFTGFGYFWGKNLNKWIDFALGVAIYESREVDNSVGESLNNSIDGKYDSVDYLLALNFNYSF